MWLIQQMQITHPEQGTTATATQACEDTPAPLQSLRHGTDMPNPTASSSPLSQLLPARTGTALRYQLKTQKKQPWTLQHRCTSSRRTCPLLRGRCGWRACRYHCSSLHMKQFTVTCSKREMLPSGKGRKGGSASSLLLIQHPLSLCHQEPNTLKVEAGLSPWAQVVTISWITSLNLS